MLFMKKITFGGLMLSLLMLVGCASTTIIPEGGNKFSVISTSDSEGVANRAAMSKATKTCEDLNRSLQVLQHASKYQGADQQTKAVAGTVSAVASMITHSDSYHSANTSDDYEVKMTFLCK